VVAKFLELAAVAGLTELPATGGKTAERVATMVVVAKIATSQLDLVERS
jgi:recombinational DNA repair protein RecR